MMLLMVATLHCYLQLRFSTRCEYSEKSVDTSSAPGRQMQEAHVDTRIKSLELACVASTCLTQGVRDLENMDLHVAWKKQLRPFNDCMPGP